MKKVTLPNLNGLRFLAAFGVTVHHIEQIKGRFGMLSHFGDAGVFRLGGLCVSLFFVLSGFLITYLLLEEINVYHTVSVTKFYLRRMLRIWPLYFFFCLLCFVILPSYAFFDLPNNPPDFGPGWGTELVFYMLFAPHVHTAFLPGAVSFVGVLWSVGVEEWFYAVWPWILKYGRRWLAFILLAIFIVMPVSRYVFHLLYHSVSLTWFLDMLRFDCMAGGGLFALLMVAGKGLWERRLLAILYHPVTQVCLYAFLAYTMFTGKNYRWFDQSIYTLLFGAAILNLAGNPRTLLRFDNRIMNWLGNLSFGMYCYNWVTTVTVVKLILLVWPGNHPHSQSLALLAEVGSLLLLLGASVLSYKYIERPFLLLKQKPIFSRLVTLPVTSIQGKTARPAS